MQTEKVTHFKILRPTASCGSSGENENASEQYFDRWPTKPTPSYMQRSRSTFKATWSSTLKLLESELDKISARNIVIQAFVDSSQIRQDGMLYVNARPRSPGVILSFNSKGKELSMPCDSCEFWQHNVRSIALALQALRAVDRYGVTKRGEQYQGWAKLPAPSGEGALWDPPTTFEDAKKLIQKLSEKSTGDIHQLLGACDKLLIRFHPDRPNGDRRYFKAVNEARELLRKEFACT